jgi:hypothetical protein
MPTFEPRRGRPPKFNRPARQVTLTLPEDVISRLGDVDGDLGRAIVRLAMAARPSHEAVGVELATFGSRAVIVITPGKVLARIPGVELVPLADGRALIALEDGTTEAQFELALRDLIDAHDVSERDLAVLRSLVLLLRDARRHRTLTLRRIMVLRGGKRSARAIAGAAKLKAAPRLAR